MLSSAPKRDKIPPSFIKNDNDLQSYLLDVTIDGMRPCVKIFVVENEFEEGVEVPVERSHQGSNAAAAPPPTTTTTQPPILEVEEERMVKDGFNGFSDDLHDFGDNKINWYGPEDADGAKELLDIVSRAVGDEGLVDSLSTQHSHPDGTGFFLGKCFDNKLDLIKQLEIASVKMHLMFCMKKSSSKLTSVACRDVSCPWKLCALKYESFDRVFFTKHHGKHTCGVQHISSHHPNPSSKILDAYYQERWKVGEIAKAIIRGTQEEGYVLLETYRHFMISYNEGSIVDLKVDAKLHFRYFFLYVGAFIKGFAHMGKVIAVDGIFLSGRYGGCLLSAMAQDTENHIFPIAFYVVDKECDNSWTYFFEKLWHIVDDSDELCIISDRHLSIGNGFKNIFTAVHRGFCTHHIAENMRKRFHCGIFIKIYFLSHSHTILRNSLTICSICMIKAGK
uniref:MULE transposase domain-containing protein n=1 Tax=Nicotiana tabacum TaxID=4097 RepID=A0A1S3XC38_TOBAC|nr:PREDICTED: uncharacterized protein LOC107763490 [Nicotiana tabacum]